MRKRLVIGAIAAAVIGIAAYVLSQPRKGSVEWHKRQYLKALHAAYGTTWGDRASAVYYRLTKRQTPLPRPVDQSASISVMSTWEALASVGYLQTFQTTIMDREVADSVRRSFYEATKARFDWRFIKFSWETPVVLTAPQDVVDEFKTFAAESALRRTDK